MNILLLILIIPALTVLTLLLTRGLEQARVVSAAGMGAQLLASFYLLFAFLKERAAGNTVEMLFRAGYKWYAPLNISLELGVDGISVAMILLTSIVMLAGVFISWQMKDLAKEFFISLIILGAGVFGFFVSLDLFSMFLFYELAVAPMYLLIGIWGSGPREYAAMKLTLMLMGGSAFLLVGIIGLYYFSAGEGGVHTFNIMEIAARGVPVEAQRFFFPLTFVGFGVLGALFPFHTWSPDGHASAPTAVSMLHAGVLMKLGGYGCFRVAVFLMPNAAAEMAWFFIILTGISVIYGAFGAIRQTDLKYINAYSSVSHCGLVLFGILMLNKTAMTGAVLQMISHGLMTALFFALIGMLYERTHTRIVQDMGGLLKVLPFISAAYVIAGLASLGLPGLSGFVAEMSIFVGAFEHSDTFHRFWTILAVSAIVVTAVYILRVVGVMLMGPVTNKEYAELPAATWFEKAGTVLLILPVAAIGMAPLWLSDMIQVGLEPLIRQLSMRF
jgi:NADH-quinone oxidoreductase subunit M